MAAVSYTKHAIQLERIVVNEASFKRKEVEGEPVIPEPKYFTGKSEYDKQEHVISVGLMVKIDGEKSGYACTVDLIGLYSVDETEFDVKMIDQWCESNAPFILHPYLRQHVFNITLNSTGDGYLLPLIEVPTSGRPVKSTSE